MPKGCVVLFIIQFLYPAIAIFLIWFLFRFIHIMFIKKRFEIKSEIVHVLYFISVMGIIGLTIFPIMVINNPEDYTEFYVRNNYIPFSSINDLLEHDYYMVPLRNIIGNILLFMPFGFILTLKFKRMNSLFSVSLIGFSCSLLIEVIQLNLPNRAFDTDDIILNTLGTGLGFLLYKLLTLGYLPLFKKQINHES